METDGQPRASGGRGEGEQKRKESGKGERRVKDRQGRSQTALSDQRQQCSSQGNWTYTSGAQTFLHEVKRRDVRTNLDPHILACSLLWKRIHDVHPRGSYSLFPDALHISRPQKPYHMPARTRLDYGHLLFNPPQKP